MAVITVAISEKGIASLAGTELGKLLSGAKVLEDGSREIEIDAAVEQKLQTAKGEKPELADRFIALVARAKEAEAEEAAAIAKG